MAGATAFPASPREELCSSSAVVSFPAEVHSPVGPDLVSAGSGENGALAWGGLELKCERSVGGLGRVLSSERWRRTPQRGVAARADLGQPVRCPQRTLLTRSGTHGNARGAGAEHRGVATSWEDRSSLPCADARSRDWCCSERGQEGGGHPCSKPRPPFGAGLGLKLYFQ